VDAAPTTGPTSTPASTETSVCGLYSVAWQPLSATERATLAGLVPGREMPYPAVFDGGPGTGSPVDDLERVSLWIAQGASVPPAGCGQ